MLDFLHADWREAFRLAEERERATRASGGPLRGLGELGAVGPREGRRADAVHHRTTPTAVRESVRRSSG